ncbi:YciI family protein [Chelatococcus asaccharovorans]|uniref:YciI family protein n=1 Tax=Chelatococcus asaccharovorans TaxID=28210 RepID=UPI00224C73B2|nr:YciI family protein [Chelatococcus asaccharovorans]CAH1663165.1 YCII domain-containing protein [Chelatococcus asaccharovorans]CAH1682939.1 YCII domain-containing protein [Chelatococcus asaccharovorans]
MLFIITCIDKPDAAARRLANYDAHKAYLETAAIRNLLSGPLVHETEDRMIGSHFLVEARSREDVEEFNRNDPFNRAGVWGEITIHRFINRVDNR